MPTALQYISKFLPGCVAAEKGHLGTILFCLSTLCFSVTFVSSYLPFFRVKASTTEVIMLILIDFFQRRFSPSLSSLCACCVKC